MFAPAQKNFSPAPRITMTWTAASIRALEDRRVDLLHHLVGVGVRRRIVQLDDGDAVGDRYVDFVIAMDIADCGYDRQRRILARPESLTASVRTYSKLIGCRLIAAARRRDVVGELAGLVDRRRHDAEQVLAIRRRRQPLVLAPRSHSSSDSGAPLRIEVQRREHADAAVELAIRQTQAIATGRAARGSCSSAARPPGSRRRTSRAAPRSSPSASGSLCARVVPSAGTSSS